MGCRIAIQEYLSMTGIDERRASEDEIIERVRHRLDHAHRCHSPRDLPFITMTYAQSLDGSIARSEGETLQLSNSLSRRLTHQVRSVHDAILVGINTVLRDNPRLNVRLVKGKNPQPVVVDSRLRLPLDACLLRDPCVRPIVFAGENAPPAKEHRLVEAGAQVIRVMERADGLLDLMQLFVRLRQMGFRSVMVEGGASIITSMLTLRLADQFLLTISPRFVGGLRAVQPQDGSECDRMPRLCNLQYQWLAEDLIIRADLERIEDDWQTTAGSSVIGHGPSPVLNSSPSNGEAEKP
jgi:3,4-dihydroxy 2-butanone 4-phosphate synthase/GTP cyclohydrolase II